MVMGWSRMTLVSSSSDTLCNMDMIVERLRPQLDVTKEDIEPIVIMGLYHHRDLIGSPCAFIKG